MRIYPICIAPFPLNPFSVWFWFDCTETHGNGNYSDAVLQNGLSEWISLEKGARRSRSFMRKRAEAEHLENGRFTHSARTSPLLIANGGEGCSLSFLASSLRPIACRRIA